MSFDFVKSVKEAPLGKTHLFSVGQAGFIIKSKRGHLLAIDLYLSDCVESIEPDHVGYRRMLPKILEPKDLIFDALVCTHFHRDHFDIDSVPSMMDNNKTKLFCAKDCIEDAKNLPRTTFVSPNESYDTGDFKLHFVNCDHGQGAPLAVGVIVEVDGYKILEVGDTCLRLDKKEEYLSFGEIDALIAPINGMYGNMNSEECALLTDALQPKLTIPCHYGMFAHQRGDPGLFHEIMDKQYPNINYLIMRLGETYTF